MAKLAIGAAQFGLDYGIQGRKKVPLDEIKRILSLASRRGADLVDTAGAYGDSEKALGDALPVVEEGFSIVTKLPKCEPSETEALLRAALERLKTRSVYGCLFHNAPALLENPGSYRALEECRRKGLCVKTGVSLYRPEEWRALLKAGVKPQLVQIPFNLFDRRFESVLAEMKAEGTETHVRSVFLQGLFAMDPAELPAYFDEAKPKLLALRKLAKENGASPVELAFRFVAGIEEIDRLVVGMVSLEELKENLRLLELGPLPERLNAALAGLKTDDERITLPFNWPKKT